MAKEVTLKQVAARSGVSYQTVSKVINGQAKVSKETEVRIWQAVKDLGYQPNLPARYLRQQRTRLIGYSWEPSPGDQGNPILDKFLHSMSQAAEGAGYHLLTFPHRPVSKSLDAYAELVGTNRVDGFVLSGIEYDDPRISFLKEKSFPFVAFGRSSPNPDFLYVDVDGSVGIRKVTRHLLNLGHQKIFVLAWPEGSRVGQDREAGYWMEMREAGIDPSPGWIVRGEGKYSFGYQATARLLQLPEPQRPSAIICLNDYMAVGSLNAIRDHGFRIGEDIAVTGFDDIPMIQYLSPPLTSVRQPLWQVGNLVINILVNRLNRNPCAKEQILLAPLLVVRRSSDPNCLDEILI